MRLLQCFPLPNYNTCMFQNFNLTLYVSEVTLCCTTSRNTCKGSLIQIPENIKCKIQHANGIALAFHADVKSICPYIILCLVSGAFRNAKHSVQLTKHSNSIIILMSYYKSILSCMGREGGGGKRGTHALHSVYMLYWHPRQQRHRAPLLTTMLFILHSQV